MKPVQKLKAIIAQDSVQDQFKNALAENAGLFTASIIDVYASDKFLQKCEPQTVVMEALKAATLRLPINKNLGFAYIVPYKGKATMQIGYKGYIQLAQRTGLYRYINAGPVYEGELIKEDKLTGEIDLTGEKTGEKVVGYFAHIETINGFRKTEYWPVEKVTEHAKRFSQSYGSKFSPWKEHFDAMATKTVMKSLLSTYGVMTTEMTSAMVADNYETSPEIKIAEDANQDVIDIEPAELKPEIEPAAMTEEEKAEIIEQEQQGPEF